MIKLTELRKACKLSVTELAGLIGVTHSSISQIERGKASPSLKVAVALADHFKVSLDTLIGRVYNNKNKKEIKDETEVKKIKLNKKVVPKIKVKGFKGIKRAKRISLKRP